MIRSQSISAVSVSHTEITSQRLEMVLNLEVTQKVDHNTPVYQGNPIEIEANNDKITEYFSIIPISHTEIHR